VHQSDAGWLDELPGLTDLVVGDARGVGRGRLIVPAQERESLVAIQPGDEPRRRTTERSAAVKQQERPARRRDIPEPRWIEHEAIHGSAQYRPPRPANPDTCSPVWRGKRGFHKGADGVVGVLLRWEPRLQPCSGGAAVRALVVHRLGCAACSKLALRRSSRSAEVRTGLR
jgi:hypothetical protein